MKRCLIIALFPLFWGCNSSLENVIERNKKLEGSQIDDVTRFDSVDVNNEVFTYHYTITNSGLDSSQSGFAAGSIIFQIMMEDMLRSQVNLENEEFRIIHESGMNIQFDYQDFKSNKRIARITFMKTPNGYSLMEMN